MCTDKKTFTIRYSQYDEKEFKELTTLLMERFNENTVNKAVFKAFRFLKNELPTIENKVIILEAKLAYITEILKDSAAAKETEQCAKTKQADNKKRLLALFETQTETNN